MGEVFKEDSSDVFGEALSTNLFYTLANNIGKYGTYWLLRKDSSSKQKEVFCTGPETSPIILGGVDTGLPNYGEYWDAYIVESVPSFALYRQGFYSKLAAQRWVASSIFRIIEERGIK